MLISTMLVKPKTVHRQMDDHPAAPAAPVMLEGMLIKPGRTAMETGKRPPPDPLRQQPFQCVPEQLSSGARCPSRRSSCRPAPCRPPDHDARKSAAQPPG